VGDRVFADAPFDKGRVAVVEDLLFCHVLHEVEAARVHDLAVEEGEVVAAVGGADSQCLVGHVRRPNRRPFD